MLVESNKVYEDEVDGNRADSKTSTIWWEKLKNWYFESGGWNERIEE